MGTNPDVYRKLQQHLDRMAVGFPATRSGIELRLLERLFSPEEAALALEVSAIPEPLSTIHGRLRPRRALGSLREALDRMAARGVINRVEVGGKVRYGKLPFAVGIYERQLARLTPEFERESRQYFEEAFGQAFHSKKTTQTRTVPVNVAIEPDRPVATYDDIRAYVATCDGPFAVMTCICRHGKDLIGDPCRQTSSRENCLTIGLGATTMMEHCGARAITREEFQAHLDDADREGLVLQPENTQHPLFICCCCGCCCGILTSAKRLPEPATYFSTNFSAEGDAESCAACGTCETRCQMEAISLESGAAIVSRSRCIGCGLCLTTCPSGALRLVPVANARVPPTNTVALYMRLFRERYGPWGAAAAATRAMLGRKV